MALPASVMAEMLTGTRSSETCDHLTEPEEEVVTWNTSAQSRHMGTELQNKEKERKCQDRNRLRESRTSFLRIVLLQRNGRQSFGYILVSQAGALKDNQF